PAMSQPLTRAASRTPARRGKAIARSYPRAPGRGAGSSGFLDRLVPLCCWRRHVAARGGPPLRAALAYHALVAQPGEARRSGRSKCTFHSRRGPRRTSPGARPGASFRRSGGRLQNIRLPFRLRSRPRNAPYRRTYSGSTAAGALRRRLGGRLLRRRLLRSTLTRSALARTGPLGGRLLGRRLLSGLGGGPRRALLRGALRRGRP